MAGIITKPNFPSAILTALLFLHPILPTIATTVGLPIPADSATLDRWISHSLKGFEERTAEIAKGIDVGLETNLVHAESRPKIITVRLDGTGDFTTIAAAVNSIPTGNTQRTIVRIGPGVYREKVKVDRSKPYVTFYGEPDSMPTISYNGTAAQFGTLESASVAVESHYFIACNIIFENSAPKPVLGVVGAQAVAMRISGDKAAFYNCKFYGYQDTLCDDRGRHFFKDCYIRGTVDFIFGNGRSIYLNCKIESVADGVTAITAQARSAISDKSGFSFLYCNITGSGNVYLSRAWRESSRVVFAYTYMGSLVNPKGWDDKGFTDRQRWAVHISLDRLVSTAIETGKTHAPASYRVVSGLMGFTFESKSYLLISGFGWRPSKISLADWAPIFCRPIEEWLLQQLQPFDRLSVFYGEYKCMGPGAATDSRVSYGKLLTDEQAKPFLSMTFIRAKTWLLPPPTI